MNTMLPHFSSIQVENIESTLDRILADNLLAIQKLAAQSHATWENLIHPMEALDDQLHQFWSPISHLNSVMNSPALRAAYHHCVPKLSAYGSQIGQNKKLYDCYLSIKKSSGFNALDYAQQKVIENAIRDFKLAGVALDDKQRQAFSELKQRLSKLQNQFTDNVMDATDSFSVSIVEVEKLKGVPEHALIAAQESAKNHKQTGYRFGLDFPSYHAIVTYAQDASLREKFYEAYVTRASDKGPMAGKWDNTRVMEDILQARYELAKLLGLNNYAEYSLSTKMAKDSKEVMDFLEKLVGLSKNTALQEYQDLQAFVQAEYGVDTLNPWDISYYSEKLREKRYAISPENLRPYFPEEKVLSGMFAVIAKLYGMKVTEQMDIDTWHKDVRFFDITDEQNQLRGQFYLDLYARPQKQGGAWMDVCKVRRRLEDGTLQIPVAYLTTNFSAPTPGQSALFTHSEVETLFHEFGHGLHHMLSKIDYPEVSGTNVPWDAVELPSQFMENFCWDPEGLALISSHHQTGEPLPAALLAKLKKAKNFQSGLQLIRQLEFSLFDFRLHCFYDATEKNHIQSLLDAVRKEVGVTPIIEYNRFQHGFSHIFGGGYAAGYYSYLWAEVLACDAFSKFEEEGVFNPYTGRAFLHHILEQGGAKEPSELFVAFRGRPPKLEPLLKERGLMEAVSDAG